MSTYVVDRKVKITYGIFAFLLWAMVASFIGFFIYVFFAVGQLAFILNDIGRRRPDLDYLAMFQNADPTQAKMFYSMSLLFIIFILIMLAALVLFLAMAVIYTNFFIRAFDEITVSGEEFIRSSVRKKSVYPRKSFRELKIRKVLLFAKNPCLVFEGTGKTQDVSLGLFSENQRAKIIEELTK